MIVSVVYPEENLKMGDNIVYAGRVYCGFSMSEELGIEVKRVFLGGHSQGGYLVTSIKHDAYNRWSDCQLSRSTGYAIPLSIGRRWVDANQ